MFDLDTSKLPEFPALGAMKASQSNNGGSRVESKSAKEVLKEYAQAGPGERNERLYSSAFKLGQLARQQRLSLVEIERLLMERCAENGLEDEDGTRACLQTINNGLTAGIGSQRSRDLSYMSLLTALDSSDSNEIICVPASECGVRPRAPYLIKSFISKGDFVLIVGPPGAGKSALIPSAMHKLCLGEPFYGLKTRSVTVLYVPVEDSGGMATRLAANLQRNGHTDKLFLVDNVTDLGSQDGEQLKQLMEIIKQHDAGLVVIDTLAMGFPGIEENSAEGMSKVISTCRAITAMGPAVILIHHTAKSGGDSGRGHSSLDAAVDVIVSLKPADKNGVVRGRSTKNRNGPCELEFAFRIESEAIGLDEDGDPITAPIAVAIANTGLEVQAALTRAEHAALTELECLLPVHWCASDSVPSCGLSDWREACIRGYNVSTAEKRESRAKAFNRACAGLLDKRRVTIQNERVRIIGQDRTRPGHVLFDPLPPLPD